MAKEANEIARASISPPAKSVWEERIIVQVAAFNKVDDTDFPETEFTVAALVDGDHVSGYELSQVKKAIQSLIGTSFMLRRSSSNDFRLYTVFDYIDYKNGVISAKLNQSLKPYFLQLKREFALLSLPEFKKLSKLHSQQLYSMLCSWSNLAEVTLSIEALHDKTNATDTQRSNFKEFRRCVLEPAEAEINAKTTLFFKWEPVCRGRRVEAVRFVFRDSVPRAETEYESEDAYVEKYQRLSNQCFEKCFVSGKGRCRPNRGKKCVYCMTRGRMMARMIMSGTVDAEIDADIYRERGAEMGDAPERPDAADRAAARQHEIFPDDR